MGAVRHLESGNYGRSFCCISSGLHLGSGLHGVFVTLHSGSFELNSHLRRSHYHIRYCLDVFLATSSH
jgi:hypothetical protein